MTLKVRRQDGIALAYLLLVSGALLPPLLSPSGTAAAIDLEAGLPALQIALASVIAVATIEFLQTFWHRDVRGWIKAAIWPAAFSLFAATSVVWSVNPELTLRRGVALMGTLALALFLTTVVGYKRSINLTTRFMAWVVLASIVVSLAVPEFGVHQAGSHAGRWKGLYLHKNLLGRETALAMGFFVLAALNSRKMVGRVFWLCMVLASTVLIVSAQSATGVVAALAVVPVAVFVRSTRRRPLLRIAIVLVAMAGLFSVAIYAARAPGALIGLLGRDLSLTGRTDLWLRVIESITNRPMLGHGYRAFWGSGDGALISADLGWRVTHAHNGWLAIALDLGLVGLVLALILVLRLVNVARWRRTVDPEIVEYGSVVAVVALTVSISDAVLLGPNNLFILLVFLQVIAAGYRRARQGGACG